MNRNIYQIKILKQDKKANRNLCDTTVSSKQVCHLTVGARGMPASVSHNTMVKNPLTQKYLLFSFSELIAFVSQGTTVKNPLTQKHLLFSSGELTMAALSQTRKRIQEQTECIVQKPKIRYLRPKRRWKPKIQYLRPKKRSPFIHNEGERRIFFATYVEFNFCKTKEVMQET